MTVKLELTPKISNSIISFHVCKIIHKEFKNKFASRIYFKKIERKQILSPFESSRRSKRWRGVTSRVIESRGDSSAKGWYLYTLKNLNGGSKEGKFEKQSFLSFSLSCWLANNVDASERRMPIFGRRPSTGDGRERNEGLEGWNKLGRGPSNRSLSRNLYAG